MSDDSVISLARQRERDTHTWSTLSAPRSATHSYMWHASSICETWHIHPYDMSRLYAWRGTFMRRMAHSFVRMDATWPIVPCQNLQTMRVTWHIMCDVTHICSLIHIRVTWHIHTYLCRGICIFSLSLSLSLSRSLSLLLSLSFFLLFFLTLSLSLSPSLSLSLCLLSFSLFLASFLSL